MLIKSIKKTDTKNQTIMRIKYFVIQSIASTLLIFSAITLHPRKINNFAWAVIIVISLTVKIARAPFHM